METKTLELEECQLAAEMENMNRSTNDVARIGKDLYELAKAHMPATEEGALAMLKLEDATNEVVRVIREHYEKNIIKIKDQVQGKAVLQ